MPLEPGRIVLVHYPFTDATAAKIRPALVVSRVAFNLGEDVVVVPISSRVLDGDEFSHVIPGTAPYFSGTKLKCPSAVKWTKPLTISEIVVRRKLEVLPPEVMSEILKKLRSMFAD